MSDFTKGPWVIGSYDPRFVFDSLGRNIATVDFVEGETVANARLIAAAPQMYEALTNIISELGHLQPDGYYEYPLHEIDVQQAQAALDAAKEPPME